MGAQGLKLAIFEGFEKPVNSDDVRRVIEGSLGPGWYPFVRVRSKGESGETSLIYTNPNNGKMRMMIVNLEPSEATLIQVSLADRDIRKWLKEPGEGADGHDSHRHHEKN